MFVRGSRYEKLVDAVFTDRRGRELVYKRLRVIPKTTGVLTHRVSPEDRLDLIAHRFFGDPEQFWRIVDANDGTMPPELVEDVGRRLVIPLLGGS